MAEAHARHMEKRARHAAYARLGGPRCNADGVAAGVAWLWCQGLYRSSRYRETARRGRSHQGRAYRLGPLCHAGRVDALRSIVARARSRPQRTHRRAAGAVSQRSIKGEAHMNEATVVTQEGDTAAVGRHRKLEISVLRYNPQERGSAPHMQSYDLEEAEGMTLFIALNEIRENQDA